MRTGTDMAETLVSVILPVYNGERYIADAVQSVFTQSYRNWELILVDDASTDATGHICSGYQTMAGVTVFRSDRRLGVSGARNAGIRLASGKYMVFLDADDLLPEDSLEKRAAVMEAHGLAMGVFNYTIAVDGEEPQKTNLCGLGRFDAAGFWGRAALFQAGNNLGFESVWDKMFRTDIIQNKKIYFRDGLPLYEDAIFSLEYVAACGGWVEVVDSVVFQYYRRSGNTASLTTQFQNGTFRRMHDTIRSYFVMLSARLESIGMFEGAVKEGVYHGYVNKMIGALYACQSGARGSARLQQEAGILFQDAYFLTGIEAYVKKHAREDLGIIDVLREKDVARLCAYLEKRGVQK